ncbi:MAG: 1-acyl-sn-glycerol-3-phosphate acyltransferase [Actinobacteria bacterium]|nr:1-acyl-sn-glycerol-3-phosphate acyltransferase [Actinomycetota bacterium]
MKPQVYKDPRPAEHFTRFHERARRRPPDPIYEVVRLILTPILLLLYRTRCIDSDKVPLEGPAVVTPNHFSFFDHFFIAVYLRRKVHFMAKSQLFQRPMQWVYTHGGVFPVLRGRRDEEAFRTAHAVLERGGLVVMYAEGGRSRTGELGTARPGVGRIALESGVPVVPVAISGSAEVRHWTRLRFPKVTVQYGDPVRFERVESPTREQSQAAADLVFERVQKLYEGLQRNGRRRSIRAARAARRAAREAAKAPARRPATS